MLERLTSMYTYIHRKISINASSRTILLLHNEHEPLSRWTSQGSIMRCVWRPPMEISWSVIPPGPLAEDGGWRREKHVDINWRATCSNPFIWACDLASYTQVDWTYVGWGVVCFWILMICFLFWHFESIKRRICSGILGRWNLLHRKK